jgi:3-mercaptopyruvate sulfurtransferase SseA
VDEYDSDEMDGEVQVQAAQEVDVAKLQKALEKANKEALDARLELRRTQLEKEYGEDIVGLIPTALPQTEWKDYADKLQAFRGQPSSEVQTEQATEEAPQEEASPEEQALAAVGTGPSGSQSLGGLPPEEVLQLAKNNPAEYVKLRDSGAASLERLPGSNR